MFKSFIHVSAVLLLGILSPLCVGAAEPLEYRWVYLQQNLQVKENLPKIEAILRRAAKSGYNGVVLADYKLNILDRVPDHYFKNAARFQARRNRRCDLYYGIGDNIGDDQIAILRCCVEGFHLHDRVAVVLGTNALNHGSQGAVRDVADLLQVILMTVPLEYGQHLA